MYVVQANPKIDVEIAKKGHFWMETNYLTKRSHTLKSAKTHRDLNIKRNPNAMIIILGFFLIFLTNNPLTEANSDSVFYSLQLGAFQDEDNAREMAEGLKRLGHNAFYRFEQDGQEEVYRVFIERYSSRKEAEREAKAMKDLDLIAAYTIKELKNNSQIANQPLEISPKGYYLHIASNKMRKTADETVVELKNTGRNVFYRYEEVPGKGKWYRVYIDGYDLRKEALKDARNLKSSGIISGYEIMAPQGTDHSNLETKTNPDKKFFLHIGSFKNISNAEKRVRELKEQNLKAFFMAEESSGTKWFKVYIGVFESEESSRKTGSELKAKGLVVYYKPIEINEDLLKE
ncbi:SPOR domain-containing protein [Thermodesulfobacteriota bacterium]